jgi:hypothetical protein
VPTPPPPTDYLATPMEDGGLSTRTEHHPHSPDPRRLLQQVSIDPLTPPVQAAQQQQQQQHKQQQPMPSAEVAAADRAAAALAALAMGDSDTDGSDGEGGGSSVAGSSVADSSVAVSSLIDYRWVDAVVVLMSACCALLKGAEGRRKCGVRGSVPAPPTNWCQPRTSHLTSLRPPLTTTGTLLPPRQDRDPLLPAGGVR